MAAWLAVTLTFVLIAPIFILTRIWRVGSGWVVIGLILAVSPISYGVFTSGGEGWQKLLVMMVGIVVLSADLAGKLHPSD